MAERATIIEAMETAFDVLGAPSPADVIHARKTLRAAIALAAAAVPPAPPAADRTPVERLRAVLETHASPTIDRGDSHGARGQKGWIVYESSLPFLAAGLAAVPPAPPSIPEREKVRETLNTLNAVLHGITWGDEFGSPLRARVIAAIAALEGK